jgi:hypothetical protein
MYNLLSDKLDRFEKEIRRVRNKFFGKLAGIFLTMARYVLKKSRAYLHSDVIKGFKDILGEMYGEVEMELERRKKGGFNIDYPGFERDTTVLTREEFEQRISQSIRESTKPSEPQTSARVT